MHDVPTLFNRFLRALWLAALLVAAPSFVRAEPGDAIDATSLLARAREASGAERWQRWRALAIAGRVTTSGLDGAYIGHEDLRAGRFDHRTVFAISRQREVWDGRTGWRQGSSGGVHRLDGDFAVRRQTTDAWLVRRGWLAADASGAWFGPVEARTLDGRAVRVTTAVPTGGQAITLFFDAATFDLVMTERMMAVSVQEVRYADYRVVDGVRLPFAIATGDQGDDDVEMLRIDRYDIDAMLPARSFGRPKDPGDWRLSGPSVTVPFDLRNGVLTIEAKIDGHGPYRFVFDTGGQAILSPALAAELGLRTVGAGQGSGAGEGTLKVQYTRVRKVEIGGLVLDDLHFYVMDLGYPIFERGGDVPLGGLFGVELLERLAVRFDYPALRVTFTPFAAHRFDARATVTRLRFDEDMPLVDGRLGGHEGTFALDTGNAGSTVVQHRWAERTGIAAPFRRGIETASLGAGGLSRSWASRIDRFEIGGATLTHLSGRYAEDRKGSFSSRTEAGNIGTQVVANFVIDLDYRRGEIGWRHVPGYVPPPFNRGGLRAVKDRPRDFLVAVVAKDSPADVAGIRAKDRIVAIDGVAASSLSGADFNDTFTRAPGTTVRVELVRDGQPIPAIVTLEELLP